MSIETIYLIRHATPDWDRRDIPYYLPPGPPLTELGRQEAGSLGSFLLAAGASRLHASPLERSLHTAQIAAEVASIPVQVDEHLIEWQPAENAETVRQRMLIALDALRSLDGTGRPVGLVTHGGPISVLLQALGMEDTVLAAQRRFDRSNPLPPAGVWEARRSSTSEPWKLRLAFVPAGQPEA